jgi:uridine phosphorylase
MNTALPNTHLRDGDVGKRTLLVGGENWRDILRILEPLVSLKPIVSNKGFYSFDCQTKSEKRNFTLCITGIGSSNTEIAVNELAKCGTKIFLRAGTSGSLRKDLKLESVVITSEALRFDGVSDLYTKRDFNPTADDSIRKAMIQSANNQRIDYIVGKTLTTSSFYAIGGNLKDGKLQYNGYSPSQNYKPAIFNEFFELLSSEVAINIEMEAATLLSLCNIFNLKAGVVCGLSNYIPWSPGEQTAHTYKSLKNALKVAIRTMEII